MAIDFKALAATVAATGADQTKSVAGGGGPREVAAAGPALCRFVGYIETGKQVKNFQGKPTVYDEVTLVFELVGKRHPPIELEDGTKLPQRVTIREKLSLNEKANYFKLFNRMNYRQDVQHMVGLLGEGFKCVVVHDKWVGKDGKERVDVVLRDSAGYTISPPRKEDEDSDTGWVDVAVPPALTEPKAFIWSMADLDQWAAIHIPGEYPERTIDGKTIPAKSKNVFQNRIIAAKNFEGSAIHSLLLAGGVKLDIPEVGEEEDEPAAAPTPAPAAAPVADALGGIV